MVLGCFDFAFVVVWIGIMLLYLKSKKSNTFMGCAIMFILFGIVLPFISASIEIDRVTSKWSELEIHDNFELLYVYLKFPVYWGFGVIQLIVLAAKNSKNEEENEKL